MRALGLRRCTAGRVSCRERLRQPAWLLGRGPRKPEAQAAGIGGVPCGRPAYGRRTPRLRLGLPCRRHREHAQAAADRVSSESRPLRGRFVPAAARPSREGGNLGMRPETNASRRTFRSAGRPRRGRLPPASAPPASAPPASAPPASAPPASAPKPFLSWIPACGGLTCHASRNTRERRQRPPSATAVTGSAPGTSFLEQFSGSRSRCRLKGASEPRSRSASCPRELLWSVRQ